MDLLRIAEFIVFLKERVDPNLIRKFLTYPEQISRPVAFTTHPTFHNAPYIQALSVIARARDAGCSSSSVAAAAAAAEEEERREGGGGSSKKMMKDAVLYTAFHQFFETKQYIAILTAEKAVNEAIMDAAKFDRHLAMDNAAKATSEIAALGEAAVQSATPVDAIATGDAKRRRTDAMVAESVAATRLHLHENYVSNYLVHDIERTRDVIKHRIHHYPL